MWGQHIHCVRKEGIGSERRMEEGSGWEDVLGFRPSKHVEPLPLVRGAKQVWVPHPTLGQEGILGCYHRLRTQDW